MERKRLLAAMALVLAGVLVYSRSFDGPFIFDDLTSIPENPNIQQLWPLTRSMSPPPQLGAAGGRPLVGLSLAVNYALGGLDVRGYHAFNLAFHLFASLLLWRVVARTLASPALAGRYGGEPAAFVLALLFCVHPLASEAVVYIVQRTELLMACFYLLTLYASLRAWTAAQPRHWQIVSVAACALGMACKEPMVTAPLMVALHDLSFQARPARELLRLRGRYYGALAATWLVLAAILAGGAQVHGALGGQGRLTTFEYLKLQTHALVHYLRLVIWPHPLTIVYDWDVPSLAAALPFALVVLALLGLTAWAFRSGRAPLGYLGAWFFVILAPTSSLLPLHTEPVAERRMYLPLAAVLALMVIGARAALRRLFPESERRERVGAAATTIAALGLGVLTLLRVQDYRTVLSVWEDALRKAPNSKVVRNNLGNAYAFAQRYDAALEQYREAVRANPDHPLAYYNIGFTLVHQSRYAEALAPLAEALRLRPNDADTLYISALALAGVGRPAEAIPDFQAALEIKPNDGEARRDYAIALTNVGRLPEAVAEFKRALEARPNDAAALSKLGNVLTNLGSLEEAARSYQESLRLMPSDVRTRSNYASVLVRLGQVPAGLEQWRLALKDDPKYGIAHYNMANVLTKDGHVAEGAWEYVETIRASPTDERLRGLAIGHLRELRGSPAADAVLSEAARDTDPALRQALAALANTAPTRAAGSQSRSADEKRPR
jgi:protein O-mannosyl-transferase